MEGINEVNPTNRWAQSWPGANANKGELLFPPLPPPPELVSSL